MGTTDCASLPGLPVDVFEVLSADRSHRAQLCFLMHSFARSRAAPSGYSLLSWRQLLDADRALAKLGLSGSTARIDPFPSALPRPVGTRLAEKDLPREAVLRLVEKLEGLLSGH